MMTTNENILREGRDSFFQYFKYLCGPDTDDTKLPTPERQLELFQRICIEHGDEFWLKCSLGQFNSILTECKQSTVNQSFFEYFFPKFNEKMRLGEFIKGVFLFLKVALWKFSNFNFAFDKLRNADKLKQELKGVPFDNVDPVQEGIFTKRSPFNIIQKLSPQECYIMGYTTNLTKVNEEIAANEEMIKEIGKQNAREYMSIDELDVYIATSMRELEEFISFKQFITDVFIHPDLAKLNLRYFDPTIVYFENRISKGLLEALMLKRAKMALYVAGEKDTFGKDSECAATLVQGKPVIVYIEETDNHRKELLDRRADIFRDKHPLGLQVCHQTGVANGVFVVRNPNDCRQIIKGLLLHTLQVRLDKEFNVGFVLKEEMTDSVIRVAIENAVLARSFENFYFKE